MSKNTVWTIIGGGNGGQSMAGHLALMGYRVRLYDIFQQTVDAINDQGGIHIDGVVEGFGALEFATTDLAKAVRGADVLAVVAPAISHRVIAENCLPHLADGQIVILHPGATCGALEFKKVLDDGGCKANIPIAETNSLIYACRSSKPGYASILGVKQDLLLATLPADANACVLEIFQEAFPQVVGAKNVLQTSLENPNAVVHPAPTVLNTSLIESKHDWLYYWDGMTPTIGRFVEELDKERLAIGKALGLDLGSIMDFYRKAYQVDATNLSDAVRNNRAYEKIQGQKDLRTRYLQEDIPTGLVPMIELGKMLGVDVSRMETIVKLGGFLLGEDYFASGRSLKNLGLDNMSSEQLEHYVQTGERVADEKKVVA
jgi:opine dehydrogenase